MIPRLLAALTDGLSAKLPALRACEAHPGPVTREEIARLSKRTPAVLAACVGAAGVSEAGDGRPDADLRLAAFVLAGDRGGLPRDRAALAAVEGILEWLPRFHPGSGLISGFPQQIRAENLFSGSLDRTGVALWAVSWRQTVRLGAPGRPPATPVPKELYAAGAPLPAARDAPELLVA